MMITVFCLFCSYGQELPLVVSSNGQEALLPRIVTEAKDVEDATPEHPKGFPGASFFITEHCWMLAPKLKIRFFKRETDGRLVPCSLTSICFDRELEPGERFVGQNRSDEIKTGEFSFASKAGWKKGATGFKFALKRDTDRDRYDYYLLLGREYKLTSKEYGGTDYVRLPETLEPGRILAIDWVVNDKKERPSKIPPEKWFEIHGRIMAPFPPAKAPWQFIYHDPKTDQLVGGGIAADGAFSLKVKNLGGPLSIRPLEGWAPAWLYVAAVKDTTLNLPAQADRIFLKEKKVNCRFHCLAPEITAVPVKQLSFSMVVNRNDSDFLTVDCIKLTLDSSQLQLKDYEATKSLVIPLMPGDYWLRATTLVNGKVKILKESPIHVVADGKNDFEIK
jgi:hypothetical protein